MLCWPYQIIDGNGVQLSIHLQGPNSAKHNNNNQFFLSGTICNRDKVRVVKRTIFLYISISNS